MANFLTEYPIIKWILIIAGVLFFVDKYLGFNPIELFLDRVLPKYKFNKFTHLNNPKLKHLIELFKQEDFSKVEKELKSYNSSYRSFGLNSLGDYGSIESTDKWIQEQQENELPKLIKAYQLVDKAWKARGSGSIDTVSKSNLKKFKDFLHEAEKIVNEIATKPSPFSVNASALLLKIYKASDIDRETIHKTFNKAINDDSNNAELNFNYFSAISYKWGGTQQELENYFQTLENKTPFLQKLILAQYYFDMVHMGDYEDTDGRIRNFIGESKAFEIDEDELYKYEFYLLLYWLSNNLGLKVYEKYYKELVKPYCQD